MASNLFVTPPRFVVFMNLLLLL